MRLFCLAALSVTALLAGNTSAPRPETTTYVDGNITGVTPHSGGTLVFSDEKKIQFRTGLATVDVPYSNITKAELGAKQTHSRNAPVYKVWALPKRMGGKTQTQLLVLEFKGDDGEARNMTLELATNSANTVVSTINGHRSADSPVTAASAPSATEKQSNTKTASAKQSRAPKADKKKKSEEITSAQPTSPAPKKADEWWGDDYWKTSRNTAKWNKTESAAGAGKSTTEKPSQSQQ